VDVRPDVADAVPEEPFPTLNPRDVDVLRLLGEGRSTGQIAVSLSVSRNTARTRIRRLQVRLDVSDRAAVVRAAETLEVPDIPRPRRAVDQ
jgi:DNA-binding NarL/FixJ family response regulator